MPRALLVVCLITALSSWSLAGEAKIPLKTDIPQEVLAGTPPDVLVLLFPGLEKPLQKAPEFMVPPGTTNLARDKKVTASDNLPVLGELKFVTDREKEGTEQSYVELGPLKQWVQVDLEKKSTIYAVYVWHYFREARSYHDVIVQVSDDPEFKKDVQTVYNNDQDNSSEMGVGKDRAYIETNIGKLIDAKGATGRYVRLYSRGNTANDLNHYVEVEIFGKPAE